MKKESLWEDLTQEVFLLLLCFVLVIKQDSNQAEEIDAENVSEEDELETTQTEAKPERINTGISIDAVRGVFFTLWIESPICILGFNNIP
jgi:hypothetical protein